MNTNMFDCMMNKEVFSFGELMVVVNMNCDKITIAYPGEDFKWPADQNGNQFIGTYQALYGINSTAAAANDDNKILNREKNLIVNKKFDVREVGNLWNHILHTACHT